MRINCLLLDTSIIADIKALMDSYAADLIDQNGKAPFDTIYREIIKDGVEIDIESAAALYKAQFDLTQNFYTDEETLAEIAGETFAKTLSAINKLEDKVKEFKTGERAPARDAADKIARMFTNSLVKTAKISSTMKVMQDTLEKAVFSTIKKNKPKAAKKPLGEMLADLLDETSLGVPNLQGQLNTMQDVVNEWREEMDSYKKGIKDNVVKEQWEKYTQEAIDAVYNVFLSNNQASQIVDQALFAKGFGKTMEDGKVVKDWKKLAGGIKSLQELENNVVSALTDEVGEANALLISESLQRHYKELRARQIDHNSKELTRRNKFKRHEVQTEIRRLLTLHDYGLFDPAFAATHKRLLARVIGAPVEDVAALGEIQDLINDFSLINKNYGKIDLVDQVINARASSTISRYQEKRSTGLLWASGLGRWVSSLNKAILYSLSNALTQNPIGNKLVLLNNAIGRAVTGKPLINDNNIGEVARAVMSDVSKGGIMYGTTPAWFLTGEDLSKNLYSKDVVERNKALQVGLSLMVGTWALDGIDAATKYRLTQQKLIYNMRKIMVDNRKPQNRAERKQFEKEADSQISKALYGESFNDAKQKARDIVKLSNGRLRNTEAFITRLADDIVKANIINNGLLTADQYASAFDAAYFSAGEAIGHESALENPLSRGLRSFSGVFNEFAKEAIKKGNYSQAAYWRMVDVVFGRIMFKFIPGASDWLVIGIKRQGLGLVTALLHKGSRQVDLSEVTEEELKSELIAHDRFRHDLLTGLVGGITTLMVFLLTRIPIGDDEEKFDDWVLKNKWARKYVYAVMPIAYSAYIATKEDKMSQWWVRTFFLDDRFSVTNQIKEVITGEGYKGRELSAAEREGNLGRVVGKELTGFPIGWRVARDIQDVYKGAILGQEKEWQEDPTSYLEGLLWGDALYEFGGVDWLKENGYIAPEDISAIKGVGGATETALDALPDMKDKTRKERLDYLAQELEKQLLERFKSDMSDKERDAFVASEDISVIFPDVGKYPEAERAKLLDAKSKQLGKHKLLKLNDKGKPVNIFASNYLIPALLDIRKK